MREDVTVTVDTVDAKTRQLSLGLSDEAALYAFLHLAANEIRPRPRNLDRYFEALLGYDLARAHRGGALVGFASFLDSDTSPRPELKHLEPITLIDTMAVAPGEDSRQVGRRLNDAVMAKRPETTPVTRAYAADTANVEFLNRLGYRPALTVPDPAGLGNDGVYLTR